MKLDELGFSDVMELYKQKNQYTKDGNLNGLIQLKDTFPELFNEQKEMEFTELLSTVNFLANAPHFKAMREKEQKKKYVQVDYQNWQIGSLEQTIATCAKVSLQNMDVVAREMIREAIIGCWDILRLQVDHSTPINDVFPYLGYLLGALICQFPAEKRPHKLKSAMFKLSGSKEPEMGEAVCAKHFDTKPSVKDQAIKDYFYALIKMVSQKFDQREGFYTDTVFFCLIESAEFIGLLMPHIGVGSGLKASDVISSIRNYINIA